MASNAGQVKVSGRFPAGDVVALVAVADEKVLRAGAGRTVERKRVDQDGNVTFEWGVDVGARYFVCGFINGKWTEIRAVGLDPDAAESVLGQPPIGYEPRKFASGGGDVPVIPSGARLDGEPDPNEPAPVPVEDLKGQALKDRAKELGVSTSGKADEIRAAIAEAEAA